MNWDAIGAIAEVVGVISVLVTLAYLAIQIRQGNLASARESDHAWTVEVNAILFEPIRDIETARIMRRASWDFEALDPDEQAVANAIWSPLFVLCQEMFHARARTSIAGDVAYQQDVIVASFMQMPGLEMWFKYAEVYLTPEFRDHIKLLLSSPDCPASNHELMPWYVDKGELDNQDKKESGGA